MVYPKTPLDDGSTVQLLNEGNPKCLHPRIFYIDIPLDGQAWSCDVCGRKEKIGYGNTPGTYGRGTPMKFPANALIRCPNPNFGGENVYAWQADEIGVVLGDLPVEKRIDKRTLDSKL